MGKEIYLALIRGINVGGKNVVKMQELRHQFDCFGFSDVSTYIQSGNVVFSSSKRITKSVESDLATRLKSKLGFQLQLMVLNKNDLETAIESNPYISISEDPKSLHFYFLARRPKSVDFEKLDSIKLESELYSVVGSVAYLFAPDGVARSKVASQLERILGVMTTARNFRTVTKLWEMLDAHS